MAMLIQSSTTQTLKPWLHTPRNQNITKWSKTTAAQSWTYQAMVNHAIHQTIRSESVNQGSNQSSTRLIHDNMHQSSNQSSNHTSFNQATNQAIDDRSSKQSNNKHSLTHSMNDQFCKFAFQKSVEQISKQLTHQEPITRTLKSSEQSINHVIIQAITQAME